MNDNEIIANATKGATHWNEGTDGYEDLQCETGDDLTTWVRSLTDMQNLVDNEILNHQERIHSSSQANKLKAGDL